MTTQRRLLTTLLFRGCKLAGDGWHRFWLNTIGFPVPQSLQ